MLVTPQGMTDNGLENAQMSQFEAPLAEKAAARYSSQAASQAEPHCMVRHPITLVRVLVFRCHLSYRLDGSWAWLWPSIHR